MKAVVIIDNCQAVLMPDNLFNGAHKGDTVFPFGDHMAFVIDHIVDYKLSDLGTQWVRNVFIFSNAPVSRRLIVDTLRPYVDRREITTDSKVVAQHKGNLQDYPVVFDIPRSKWVLYQPNLNHEVVAVDNFIDFQRDEYVKQNFMFYLITHK